MKSIRDHIQGIAGGLLLLLALVFTPKELWHSCEHHSSAEHTEHNSPRFQGHDECGICDFNWLPFTPVESIIVTAPYEYPAALNTPLCSAVSNGNLLLNSDRAPPPLV
ncbi:MAG: hypothetical protein RLP14_04445 [Owenweeksia sp.]